MAIRYPAPLVAGDRIGVTSPSSGVPDELRARLDFSIQSLQARGFEVVVGQCMSGQGVVSASPEARAAELTAMLTDPGIRAVVPPWGGELAIELMPHLDLAEIARAEPTWFVGYSDISTLLFPLTVTTGIATVHGQNLMDTAYRVPDPLVWWVDVVTAPPGVRIAQGASRLHRADGFDDWEEDPTVTEFSLDTPGGWSLLDESSAGPTPELTMRGRLIGGCIETISVLAGTRFADLRAFAAAHAPEGLIVYVEAAEDNALNIARDLWRMRLAGWFDDANGILVGRTRAPDSGSFTQRDAVRSALAGLGIPVVLDVDCGHVPPHLALVNGALTEVTVGVTCRLVQSLVP